MAPQLLLPLLAIPSALAIGTGVIDPDSGPTLCGDGFHADPLAAGEACAAAVGEHVRGDYLKNLGGMSVSVYRLACCAENHCVPYAEAFGGRVPRGYELLNPAGDTASGLGAMCAEGYDGEPVAVCPRTLAVFLPLSGCAKRRPPSASNPVGASTAAEWAAAHGPQTDAAWYWLAKKEIGYFLLLGAAAARVAASLAARLIACLSGGELTAGSLLYCAALAALASWCAIATWTEIVRFIYEDIAVFGGSSAYWLAHSKVFVRAYLAVTDTAAGWWWSCQLLVFVAPLMLFFRVHALRHPGIPVLAYALLGFLGAISLATPLFLLEVALRSHTPAMDGAAVLGSAKGAPSMPSYTACALGLSMVCSLLLPTAVAIIDEATEFPYKVLLITLHDALIIAAVPIGWRLTDSSSAAAVQPATSGLVLFTAAAGALAVASHLLNTAEIVRDLFVSPAAMGVVTPTDVQASVVGGGFPLLNPCQASISTDVIGTTLTVAMYIAASTAGVTKGALLGVTDGSIASSASGGIVKGCTIALCFCAAVPVLSLCGACCALVLVHERPSSAPDGKKSN